MGECSETNTFGTYDSLLLAEIECFANMECVGILDDGCDNKNNYRLCKRGFMNPSTSCISQKKAYNGTYFFLLCHVIHYYILLKTFQIHNCNIFYANLQKVMG